MAEIDRLFDNLLAMKGSDLHLGIGYPPLARTRGELVPMRDEPVTKMPSTPTAIRDARRKTSAPVIATVA